MSETPEHGREPIPGLPGYLPEGEKILWQGKPTVLDFAIRTLHLRKVAIYFALLLGWRVLEQGIAGGHLQFVALSLAGLGLLSLLAWLMVRSTLYTITNRRLVLRFGIAMPISINLPFARIQTLATRRAGASATDISIGIRQNPLQRLSYVVMWPHAQPWRLGNVQPMMRCLNDGTAVAEILRKALLTDTENQAVRHSVEPAAGHRGRKQPTRPKYEPFPRAPLIGAAALIGFAIVSVATIRVFGPAAAMEPLDNALESVQLQFEDQPGGVISVFDATSGSEIGELPAGSDNFMRATLRGLVRGRDALKAEDRAAFGLYRLSDGRLLLVDPVSGRNVDLWAFGETNANAFARFLPSSTAQVPQHKSDKDAYELMASDTSEQPK